MSKIPFFVCLFVKFRLQEQSVTHRVVDFSTYSVLLLLLGHPNRICSWLRGPQRCRAYENLLRTVSSTALGGGHVSLLLHQTSLDSPTEIIRTREPALQFAGRSLLRRPAGARPSWDSADSFKYTTATLRLSKLACGIWYLKSCSPALCEARSRLGLGCRSRRVWRTDSRATLVMTCGHRVCGLHERAVRSLRRRGSVCSPAGGAVCGPRDSVVV